MEVILTQDVKNLGKQGETVKVSQGYGRNFLIPRGLAVEATKSNLRHWQHQRKLDKERELKEKGDAEKVKDTLDGFELVMQARCGEGGRLFGSVTSTDLINAIQKETGIELDKRKLELEEPIKSIGDHKLRVRLLPGVTASLNVKVEASE
ncbi:MAG: 50S ribosomal protein L9 [Firmicutes bacterium]|nr:50S ribosomal protein L9 [Bacillota bacterium]